MRRFAFTHSRLVLIWVCLGVQAVALAGAGVFTCWTFRRVISRAVEERILNANTQVADRYTDLIEGLGVTDLDPDGPGWERIQSVIERADLPGGAFMCVTDAQGNVVCHPEIRNDPSLRGLPLGKMALENASDGSGGPLAQADPSATVTGRLGFFGNTHYVATRVLPGLNARLIVHQPESGLVSLSAGQMAKLIGGIVMASLIVMAATGVTIWWMSGRHDRRLDRFHAGLGEEIEARLIQSLASRHALIFGLAKLADCRDTETGAHLERICAYSLRLAEQLRDQFDEIDDAWLECVRVAPCLHDIGKVGIPDAILLKPGPLTEDERHLMQGTRTSAPTRWAPSLNAWVATTQSWPWASGSPSSTTSAGTARDTRAGSRAIRSPCRPGSSRWPTSTTH